MPTSAFGCLPWRPLMWLYPPMSHHPASVSAGRYTLVADANTAVGIYRADWGCAAECKHAVGHTLALGVFWLNPEGQLLWAPARHVLPLDNSLGHRVACWRPRRIRLSITVQMAGVVVRLLSRVTVLDRQFEEDMRNVLCQRYYPWPGRLVFRWRNFGRRGSSSII